MHPVQIVFALICLVLLAFGLLWLVSKVAERVQQQRRYVAPSASRHSSQMSAERGSYHVERPVDRPGTVAPEPVPDLAEQVQQATDDQLIRALALARNPDGSWRYAESRIGKFAPGRLEDRIEQVRAIRGTPAPTQPPSRELVVRDKAGERRIPFDEVTV